MFRLLSLEWLLFALLIGAYVGGSGDVSSSFSLSLLWADGVRSRACVVSAPSLVRLDRFWWIFSSSPLSL